MGQNSGPIFRRLWTKVHQIWQARRGVIAVSNRFPIDDMLFPSGDIRDQVAKSEISLKF